MLIIYQSAYDLYADPHSNHFVPPKPKKDEDPTEFDMATRFLETFSRKVEVRFVGVW